VTAVERRFAHQGLGVDDEPRLALDRQHVAEMKVLVDHDGLIGGRG
jgi:hypothetical protein